MAGNKPGAKGGQLRASPSTTLLMHLLLAGPFKVPYRHHLIHCGPPSEEDIALLSGLED